MQTQQLRPQLPSTEPQDWRTVRRQERRQRLARWRQERAGVPIGAVLLIVIGLSLFFGNFGLSVGWLFGLALGAWFVYLGLRPAARHEPINGWLTGLGLLIGLGAVSTGVTDQVVFPVVLVIIGLGILGQQFVSRQNPR
jgi:hypothetical protein